MKFSLFSCVGKEEVFLIVKKESNSLHTINRRKCNLIGPIWLGNCLIVHDIALKKNGRLEVIERRRKRRKQPQNNLQETRGYWKLNEAAVESAV